MPVPPPNTAALYLRSSKDRSDVSIEAQRHELTRFAAEQNLTIVAEFSDVVESGKEENRPGLVALVDELKSRGRGWQIVLAFDTARIARRRFIAVNFEHECEQRGVRVLYKNMAGIDPETEVLILSVFQGMDHWHSLISKRKARDGMATNVRRGYRAGGRAPIGYRLKHIDTGAVREGRPVLKSQLELDPSTSGAMQKYLRTRAAGMRRELARQAAGLDCNKSSLVGIEWNALTYAGMTVWNVNAERKGGGYAGGTKRRPRAEWEVKKGTHPPLISEEEAEQVLAQLEAYSLQRPRQTAADYLLSGLLKTTAGAAWKGADRRYYRTGTRKVNARDVDGTVLEAVARDLNSREFAERMVQRSKASAGGEQLTEAQKLRTAAAALERRIASFVDMAGNLEAGARGPVLRRVQDLERDRTRMQREIDALQREGRAAREAGALTEESVAEHLNHLAAGAKGYDREALKHFLSTLLAGVTLDPGSDELQLNYRIELQRVLGWRPHEKQDQRPVGKLTTYAKIKRAA